jgi:general secretion pathway protein J
VRAGFTLIELMVALAIMGMIALMLLGSTQYGVAIWQRTDLIAQTTQDLALSRAILARDLELAYPEWSVDQHRLQHVPFEGTNHSLAFLAPSPESMGRAGMARFMLRAAEGRLELSAVRELGTVDPPPASVLVSGARSIELAYFGPAALGEAPSWQRDWQGRADLPLLVRIRVGFAPGDPRSWPELIVRPRIAEDASCVYDTLSYHCRGR